MSASTLVPYDVQPAVERGATVYYGSFGNAVARFEGTQPPVWLAPKACAYSALGARGR